MMSHKTLSLHCESAQATFYRKSEILKPSDAPFPRQNSSLESLCARVALLMLIGSFYAIPASSFVALYYATIERSPLAAAWICLLILDAFLPAGKCWAVFHHSKVWDNVRRLYRMRVLVPEDSSFDPKQKYLMAQFPHACFPLAAFLTGVLTEDAGFRDKTVPGAVASILLQLPFVKHIFAWTFCFPASKNHLLNHLRYSSVGMCPEGVAGVFQGANRRREQIYLNSRKGFIRLAIQAGVDILPIYHLGNSQLLSYRGSAWLSRKLRMTVGVGMGLLGSTLPYRTDFVTVVGHPIKEKQNGDPRSEEVENIHKQLVEELKSMYYQHRHLSSLAEKDLTVI